MIAGVGRACLSVVVPCYNEQAVLPATHAELQAALAEIPNLDYELVYVDDGSTDGTFECLRRFQSESARVRVLRLSRNFGPEVARTAGLAASAGDACVWFDADLQDPPAVIADLVAQWRAGADVAYAVRQARLGETRFKRWSADLFYRLLDRVAEHPVPRQAGDFRLLDRKVVDALLAMPERDRFGRALVAWAGFRQVAVPYRRQVRAAGETKMPLGKLARLAVDGLASFSLAPLRLATWFGLAIAGAALIGIAGVVIGRLFADAWAVSWVDLVMAIAFLGGVQLVAIGILGEYVGRIYGEVKRRPMYFVASRLGFEEPARFEEPVRKDADAAANEGDRSAQRPPGDG